MKKETLITTLITTILNLLWSLVFDIFPNFVDFSFFNEMPLAKFGILIIGLLVINLSAFSIFRFILKKTLKKDLFISQFESAINILIEEEASEIPDRPPHMSPGLPQPILHYYHDVVLQIKESNGKIEFSLEDYPQQSFNPDNPVFISNITPGMSKYFMVITQEKHEPEPDYVRIRPDYKANPEEFTYTWFDKILPILGNISTKISVKEMPLPNMPESHGYFEIKEYKFVKRNGKSIIVITVI